MKTAHRRHGTLITLATLALAIGTAMSVQAAVITAVGTTGVYDESTNATNQLDVARPAGSLPVFKTDVLNAYNTNLGGVIDWETGANPTASSGSAANNSLTTVSVSYGVGAGNTLTVAFDRSMELYTNDINNQILVLSQLGALHDAILPSGTGAGSVLFTMAFSGAGVRELGASMPSRTTYGASGVDFRVTANYSGGGSTAIDDTIGNVKGTDDTFFHFAAPTSETITSLAIQYVDDNGQNLANGQRRPILDDLGFIVVPEPATGALAAVGLAGLIRRRRRACR